MDEHDEGREKPDLIRLGGIRWIANRGRCEDHGGEGIVH